MLATISAHPSIEDNETLAVPPDMVRSRKDNYVLRVEGNSMIEEQIRDGDYIVVQAQQNAEDGEMVVALVGGDSATVKKLYREAGGRVRLTSYPRELLPDPHVKHAARRPRSVPMSNLAFSERD